MNQGIIEMKHYSLAVILLGRILSLSAKGVEQAITEADIYYETLPRLGIAAETKMTSLQNLTDDMDIKVVVHGYMANRTHYSIVPIKHAYLSQGIDNVFMADWQRAASFNYATSRNLIRRVGQRFAKILADFLTKHKIDTNKVHLIGHSLGAHVVGAIGRNFNGSLSRITGRDPALPLFAPDSKDGLKRGDGRFVDVIHTDTPFLGDGTPRGDADFYPNYGKSPQPGCRNADRRYLTICSHVRAVQLYAESIELPNNFPATFCSLKDIQTHYTDSCQRESSNTTVMMGEHVDQSASGQYFLETFSEPPFGKGLLSKEYAND